MPLESGNFVNDLVPTNPPGTDLKSQGDDHIQLIKKVLKNTFPGATRAFNIPTGGTINVSTTLTADMFNRIITVDTTGGAINLTMPTLVGADAGWEVTLMKALSAPPMFILPPSGFIFSGGASLAKTRRSVPMSPFRVIWTGGNWIAERCVKDPVCSVVPLFAAALPGGFEWPNGQVLAAADYPDYVAFRGSGGTPDLRQRSLFGTNLGGADTGRITSVISPTLDNGGGNQFMHNHGHGGLTGFQTANHVHGFATGINNESIDHTHSTATGGNSIFATWGTGGSSGTISLQAGATTGTSSIGHGSHTHSGTTGSESANHQHGITAEGAGASQNMPPCIICNYALIVE